MDTQPADRLLKTAEVAALLRVTPRAIQKWARQDILRPIKLPGRKNPLGYLESEVLKLLKPEA